MKRSVFALNAQHGKRMTAQRKKGNYCTAQRGQRIATFPVAGAFADHVLSGRLILFRKDIFASAARQNKSVSGGESGPGQTTSAFEDGLMLSVRDRSLHPAYRFASANMKYRIDEKYNSFDRLAAWDKESQKVIENRMGDELGGAMKFSFLAEEEGSVLKTITDILVDQQKGKPYVKIAEIIDAGLSFKKEGVKYGDNPWKGEFYKKGLKAMSARFESAKDRNSKRMIITEVLNSNTEDFAGKFLREVLRDSASIYYSHPHAWSEVGFPGPAYPEGYYALSCGEADSWEPQYILNKPSEEK